jgi:Protein of unknown function (DUF3326)
MEKRPEEKRREEKRWEEKRREYSSEGKREDSRVIICLQCYSYIFQFIFFNLHFRLLASVVDVLVTHPNVLNGAMLSRPMENVLYVEGSEI